MSGVFEIREYLDDQGQAKNNEMVDITAELERFAKMGGELLEKQEALDEEKQFIRELADMAEKTEDARRKALEAKRRSKEGVSDTNDSKTSDDLDDVLDKIYEASISKPKSASSNAVSKPKTATKGSGWKSGFLSGPSTKPVKKAAASDAASSTSSSSIGMTSSDAVKVEKSNPSDAIKTEKSGAIDPASKNPPIKDNLAESNNDSSKKKVVFNQEVSEQRENRTEATSSLKDAPAPTEVPEVPRENVFSQQKHMYQRHNPMAAASGIKPLPKIPKGETTKVAFTGTISERN